MSEIDWQFVAGVVRTGREARFYVKLHPCPQCGSRDYDKLDWSCGVRVFDDRTEHYAEWHHLVCPRCRHERKLHCLADRDGEKQLSNFEREVERRHDYNADNPAPGPIPDEVFLSSLHLAAPPEPSTLIQAYELAQELVRLESVCLRDRSLLEYRAWRDALDEVADARTCIIELRKFFPEGAEEIPDEHVRTDAARAARAAHPEWFRRSWVEAQAAHWDPLYASIRTEAEFRRALPAADPRSFAAARAEAPPVLPPFHPASLEAHDQWLDDKGGARLHAKGADATGMRFAVRDLTAVIFEDVVLDRADLSFAKLHGAALTRVRARGANFASAMIAGADLIGCDFSDAAMSLAKLGDSKLAGCDFSRADLERSTWYRAQATRCTFAGANLRNGGWDKAVFTDCDFRGADFSMAKPGILGSTDGAQFIRCDLRDTRWAGLDLFRVQLVDCKLAGASGAPSVSRVVVERADLSPAGDGSQLGGLAEVCQLWGVAPPAPPPPQT